MLFFLPFLIAPVVFLFCRGLLRQDSTDATGFAALVSALSAILFMILVPVTATDNSDEWRVQFDEDIESEIQVSEKDDNKVYSFWAGGKTHVLNAYHDDVQLIPARDDADVAADRDHYTVLCDSTPGIVAPFHYGDCVHRISLTEPLED